MNDHLFRFLNAVQKSDFWPLGLRRRLLRKMGVNIADGAIIMSNCDFLQGRISIGRNTFVNQRCLFEGAGGIIIGEEVRIGHASLLLTSTHEIGNGVRRAGALVRMPVVLESGCWLGASCTILAGAVIGERSIVGAGSVVIGALAKNELYVGSPARSRKKMSSEIVIS